MKEEKLCRKKCPYCGEEIIIYQRTKVAPGIALFIELVLEKKRI